MTVMLRGTTWNLRKRVPARYATVEPRKELWLSLHTDSKAEALAKAPAIWRAQIEAWEARLAGASEDAEKRFQAAQELAAKRGFSWLPLNKVTDLPREDLLQRIEAIPVHDQQPNRQESAAILGAVPAPQITVSRAVEHYWGLTRDRVADKSPDQLRRWRNPRIKAANNLISVIGDKPISAITGEDMLAFRGWWLDRIDDEGLSANSANKDLIHVGDILKTVNKMKRLGLVLPLGDLALKEGKARPRLPFSSDWIRERLLAPGALDGLNAQARAIFLLMINTGARPSELAALSAETIHLQANTPYIEISAENRQLKSVNAERKIPVLGVSLDALRSFPEGLDRYRTNSASLSATVNKFLKENGLKETDGHTMYGLRHAFEDRMLGARIDERIRRDLMGHALDRVRYGQGGSLADVASRLAPISF
ncbi:integrase [Thioclava sp. SK-1]|uniref:tyrosine-type recombinase/integrase n=1 Tax=Thioclava sp. SK-1 TaxID=1889770 RepID=UPI000825DC0F|nr:tyrosine-type recombinase/integrase [Thioclava sp. SK-1]OCX66863.1 integrase [Thioclava sp. SK-1]